MCHLYDDTQYDAVKMASNTPSNAPSLLFRQLFDGTSSTYTYLLADMAATPQPAGVLIDPVDTQTERDAEIVQQLGIHLAFAANTHVHADHVTGTANLRKVFPGCKSVISEASGARADVLVKPFDRVDFGQFSLEVRPTPGHTAGCVTYVLKTQAGTMAFTGDALLIRGCGRTDFQGGDPQKLYESVHEQIFSLPDDTLIYPAHDYKGRTCSSVREEKAHNLRVTKSLADFIEIMNNLNLPRPKLIDALLHPKINRTFQI